jgi:peptidoglycan/xylan/chitin deacetylase (PgdA/CDA1 family)
MKILMYHYVRDFKKTKFPNIKGLDVRLFEKQIKYLKKNFDILKPTDVNEIVKKKKSFKKNTYWLTFDDGYSDHYKYVYPILEKYKIKATFFPPVISTKDSRVLNVNKIQHILSKNKDKKKLLCEINELYLRSNSKNTNGNFKKIYKNIINFSKYDDNITFSIKQLLQVSLPFKDREIICSSLFKKYVSSDEKIFSKKLYMNLSQIKEMKNNGHEFGIHGYNHNWLGSLNKKDQIKEICGSLNFWKKNKIIKNNFKICYPFGDYNNDTLKILSDLKCFIGVTIESGLVSGKRYSPLTLPRIDIKELAIK